MPTLHFHETTTATPEEFLDALTDFGPGRSKIFGNTDDGYLKVYSRSADEADVTEGSGGIWERLHYDWHDPNHVVMTTMDSNTWGGGSGHTYTFMRRADGKTDIDAVVVRDGKNFKGRMLGLLFSVGGSRVLEERFKKTLKAIESRHDSAKAS